MLIVRKVIVAVLQKKAFFMFHIIQKCFEYVFLFPKKQKQKQKQKQKSLLKKEKRKKEASCNIRMSVS
jgi:hypothetical protein